MNRDARNVVTELGDRIASARDGDVITTDVTGVLVATRDSLGKIDVTRHPLGFLHFNLSRVASDRPYDLRLHIWSAGPEQSGDDLGRLHDHTWLLKSLILVGAVYDTAFTPVPSSDGSYTKLEARYKEGVIAPTRSRWDLLARDRRMISSGVVYTVDIGTPHITEIETFPTATLVTAIRSHVETASIFSKRDLPAQQPANRETVDQGCAHMALEAVLETLR